jgi:hypothetical protein
MSPGTEIDDDYPTCERTYATLRIFRDDLDPDSVTRTLGIEPTRVQVKEQPSTNRFGGVRVPEIGGWLLSTEGQVTSRDVRRHLLWLLDKLAGSDHSLGCLRMAGCRIDVFCFWLSAEGHGGPTLSPEIMKRLGELGLEVGFDVYG